MSDEPTGPPSAGRAPSGASKSPGLIDQIAENSWLSAAAVVAGGAALSYVLWDVLAIPGTALKDAIPRGNCTSETPGSTGMYFCSVRAGALTALGPLLAVLVAVFFRRPLMAQLQKLMKRAPAGASIFVTPLMSTAMFTLTHAAVHEQTGNQSGLVPQRFFPALIGLFTFGAARLGPSIATRYAGTIDRRNTIPAALRILVALAIPVGTSYLLTDQDRVTDTAQKEQLVVLLTLFTSYAAFVPRDGDFLGAAQRLLSSRLTYRSRR